MPDLTREKRTSVGVWDKEDSNGNTVNSVHCKGNPTIGCNVGGLSSRSTDFIEQTIYPGQKAGASEDLNLQTIVETVRGFCHFSRLEMAEALGLSPKTIQLIELGRLNITHFRSDERTELKTKIQEIWHKYGLPQRSCKGGEIAMENRA